MVKLQFAVQTRAGTVPIQGTCADAKRMKR
jgi:hypothetical protein